MVVVVVSGELGLFELGSFLTSSSVFLFSLGLGLGSWRGGGDVRTGFGIRSCSVSSKLLMIRKNKTKNEKKTFEDI